MKSPLHSVEVRGSMRGSLTLVVHIEEMLMTKDVIILCVPLDRGAYKTMEYYKSVGRSGVELYIVDSSVDSQKEMLRR